MQAETQRTLAETRKLDNESHMDMQRLAVDAITKSQEHRHKMATHQHKVLMDRVNTARDMMQQMQPPPMQDMQQQPQPQPDMGPNQ
jgi:hypothetical protein